ncbi:S8 family serine peptidase [Marinobacter sp. chi1]|uniref:S8 family serine peptidase n=1 Tax=Marinobacter suaedae TaxID=3057675 RepID=A0ABT8VWV2_9GAMM|nr:S8 family serine peptidase [Marinobacter sp. chi1]MDO3720449.1 S8 family serine peptidase [Marinobacter sp. chi1]
MSGTIDIEAGTRVDFDNADALRFNAVPRSTDQSLPQEFILSGYVSATQGTYPSAPDFPAISYPADPQDSFSMALAAGQALELQAFATRAGPSSVRLTFERDGEALASNSGSTGTTFGLTNTGEEGVYTVRVDVLGDLPVLYVLSSALAPTGQARNLSWPDHEVIEGEAIVGLTAAASGTNARALVQQTGMTPMGEVAPGFWRVAAPAKKTSMRDARAQAGTLAWIESLRKQPGIASVEPNYKMHALASPLTEPLYENQQWHYGLLNAPTAWQLAPGGGAGVTVAVMDTGLYRRSSTSWHRDLDANVVPGLDFVSEQFDNDGQPGPDNNPSDPGNSVGNSVFHGTHVAGTVAALANDAGGTGVAFGSSLMPVRVLGEGGVGSAADLLNAIRWVNGPESGSPRADIVNLSLGGLPFIQVLQDAIDEATARGVVFVAAAGNSATSTESFPAAFRNVFAVSAVDGAGELASYSNRGNWIDLAAPGGDASRDGNADGRGDVIVSTSASVINGTAQETYIGLQGTSMAAPHVSGVMALMKSINGTLDFASLNALLVAGDLTVQTCVTPPCSRDNRLGWGLMDAGKSALAAQNNTVPELLTASPAIVTLSTEGERSATVVLEAFGSELQSVRVNSVSAPPDWLTLNADLTGALSTRFELPMTLNPEALGNEVSKRTTLVIEYTSDQARTLEIPVVGRVVSDQNAKDAGRHFVLLVAPEPQGNFYVTVGQANVVAENGQYRFSFVPDDGEEPLLANEVPPGDYFLVAGTDLDNDGLICHSGEACAEYPVAGLREVITLPDNGPVTGIRMTTSYSRPSISARTPDLLPRPGFQGYQLLSAEPAEIPTKAIAEP